MGLLDSHEFKGPCPWASTSPTSYRSPPPSSSGHWISKGPIVMLLLWLRPYGQHGICGPAQAKSSTFVAILGTKVPGFVWDPLGGWFVRFPPTIKAFPCHSSVNPCRVVGVVAWECQLGWIPWGPSHQVASCPWTCSARIGPLVACPDRETIMHLACLARLVALRDLVRDKSLA